jgi:hypothetical protein
VNCIHIQLVLLLCFTLLPSCTSSSFICSVILLLPLCSRTRPARSAPGSVPSRLAASVQFVSVRVQEHCILDCCPFSASPICKQQSFHLHMFSAS